MIQDRINRTESFIEEAAITTAPTWFALVGDNGFGITTGEGYVIEAVRNLRQVVITSMPSEDLARQYAYAAYCSRFMMRNAYSQVFPMVPGNLPANVIFYDPHFDEREGQRKIAYFPGIPV